MQFGRLVSTVWSNLLPASSVQYKIKRADSSSTLVSNYMASHPRRHKNNNFKLILVL